MGKQKIKLPGIKIRILNIFQLLFYFKTQEI